MSIHQILAHQLIIYLQDLIILNYEMYGLSDPSVNSIYFFAYLSLSYLHFSRSFFSETHLFLLERYHSYTLWGLCRSLFIPSRKDIVHSRQTVALSLGTLP